MSDSLRPHESQHTRPPCPSPTPRGHSNASIKSVMPSSHLIVCRPLLLPPIPPSIRVFSNESTLRMRWPKYWSCSFSIIPSKEIPGLISILKEISPEYSLEGLMLKLKLQYFGHLMCRINSLEKTLTPGKIDGKRIRGQQRMRRLMASLTQWT